MPLQYVATEPAAPPAEGEAPGLLLLLHGSGDSEQGLLPLGAALAPPTYRVASLRAPLQSGWGPGAYQWFEGMSRQPEPVALERTLASSCDAVFDFILVRGFHCASGLSEPRTVAVSSALGGVRGQAAPDTLGIDPAKIAVLGFSQGATMVWTLLLSRWPRANLICAAVALSGRLMPQLLEAGAPLHERLAPAGQSAALPLFCSHGGRDEMTPVAIGRANRPFPISARDLPRPHPRFLTGSESLQATAFSSIAGGWRRSRGSRYRAARSRSTESTRRTGTRSASDAWRTSRAFSSATPPPDRTNTRSRAHEGRRN